MPTSNLKRTTIITRGLCVCNEWCRICASPRRHTEESSNFFCAFARTSAARRGASLQLYWRHTYNFHMFDVKLEMNDNNHAGFVRLRCVLPEKGASPRRHTEESSDFFWRFPPR